MIFLMFFANGFEYFCFPNSGIRILKYGCKYLKNLD